MGASFDSALVPEKDTDLRAFFQRLRDQRGYENGHGYSGSFAEKSGVSIDSHEPFPDEHAAAEYISEHYPDKWMANAIAVRFHQTETIVLARPTYGGKEEHYSTDPAVLFNFELTREGTRFLPADQLPPTVKAKVTALATLQSEQRKALQEIDGRCKAITAHLFEVGDATTMREINALRFEKRRAVEAKIKTDVALAKLSVTYGPKLYRTTVKDHGIRWLIGAWCSS